jgi:prepilin-type N-terminal cleavage/methylation domain-containing protein
MRTQTKSSQSGFTLVEIAIVLVIIGLLLGGVLKGTELIENSKVKRAASEINGIGAGYYSYLDRYKTIPGDDGPVGVLNARGGAWTTVTEAGGSNGILTVAVGATWNAASGTEHGAFWQHVRAAGFINGDATAVGAAGQPRNAFGGLIGITTANVNGNLQGLKVCLSQVSGKSAQALDTQLDDGNGATGRTRATLGAVNANTNPNNNLLAAPYSEDSYYTLCTQT